MDQGPGPHATPAPDILAGETAATPPPPFEDAAAPGGELGSLAADVATDLGIIARDELALAKTELKGEAATAVGGVAAIGAGAAAGGLGALFLLLALFEALSRKLPRWAAAGLIGLALSAVAAQLGLGGRATLGQVNLKPQQTIASLRDTTASLTRRLAPR